MANHTTGAQRRNARMEKIFETAKRLKTERDQKNMKYPNGRPMFRDDGMMLDDKGNRSIFDDVDE